MTNLADRLLGLADEPTDHDDLRLRKRVGVLAGYIPLVLPLQLPLLAQAWGTSESAESYQATAVLFADLVGFTPWVAETDATKVVDFLDSLFSRFDDLAAHFGVENDQDHRQFVHGGLWRARARPDHAHAAMSLASAMLETTGRACRDSACHSICA